MMDERHLMRTWYQTDATMEEPEYVGAFAGGIPGASRTDGQIISADWSKRGWVELTYLLPGPHPTEGNVPFVPPQDADAKAHSVAALIVNSLREQGENDLGGYVRASDDDDMRDVIIDGRYDLLELARAIITEVRSDYE